MSLWNESTGASSYIGPVFKSEAESVILIEVLRALRHSLLKFRASTSN